MRTSSVIVIALLAAHACCSQGDYSVIQGYVTDLKTGASIQSVKVEVFDSQDHSKPQVSAVTDQKGFYSVEVPVGSYYDVYLVSGEARPNQRTTEAVRAGVVYTVNFKIDSESDYSATIVEKYGIELAAGAAAVFLLAVAADQLLLRRRPKAPGLKELKDERDRILQMLEMAKTKYHRREMDEDSLRQITKDKQERLIELESKIRELGGDGPQA